MSDDTESTENPSPGEPEGPRKRVKSKAFKIIEGLILLGAAVFAAFWIACMGNWFF